MNIETKGKKDEGISRPAGINDVTSIVSIAFTVNNRDKEMDIDKKAKKKTKTILLNNAKREVNPLSTEIVQGMRIQTGNINKKDMKSRGNEIGD